MTKPTRTFGLIVIGDEILSGKRVDKHLPRFIELLKERGLKVTWSEYIGDDPERIVNTLKRTFDSGDVVFCTGGIGATPDDYTRQAAANALGVPVVLHPEAKELIGQRIIEMAEGDPVKSNLDSPDNVHRFRMGEFPVGAKIIPNSYNRIPGFYIREHYFMPGFPVMASPMMEWVLETFYQDLFHQEDFVEQSFIVVGGIEATLTPLMEEIEQRFPSIKVFSLPSVGDPSRGGVFARRHIELGVKGPQADVIEAFRELRNGVKELNVATHELK